MGRGEGCGEGEGEWETGTRKGRQPDYIGRQRIGDNLGDPAVLVHDGVALHEALPRHPQWRRSRRGTRRRHVARSRGRARSGINPRRRRSVADKGLVEPRGRAETVCDGGHAVERAGASQPTLWSVDGQAGRNGEWAAGGPCEPRGWLTSVNSDAKLRAVWRWQRRERERESRCWVDDLLHRLQELWQRHNRSGGSSTATAWGVGAREGAPPEARSSCVRGHGAQGPQRVGRGHVAA